MGSVHTLSVSWQLCIAVRSELELHANLYVSFIQNPSKTPRKIGFLSVQAIVNCWAERMATRRTTRIDLVVPVVSQSKVPQLSKISPGVRCDFQAVQ